MDNKDFDLNDILHEYDPAAEEEAELPLPAEEAAEEYSEEEYTEEDCAGEEAYEEEYPEEKKPRRKRRVWPWVLLAAFLLLIGGAAAAGFYAYGEAMELVDVAYATMDEAKEAVELVKESDFAAVERSVASIDAKLDTIDATLDEPLWRMAAKVPGPGDDLGKLRALFTIWDHARDGIVTPVLTTLQEQPLPDLEDADVKALLKETDMMESYVELALAVLPECERCMDEFEAIPSLSISQLEEKMEEVRELIQLARPYLPFAEDVLTNGARPAIETLKAQPLDQLKSSDENYEYVLDYEMILAYLDLAEELIPRAEGWLQELDTLPELPVEKLSETVDKAAVKAEELLALYHRGERYIPLARAFLDVDTSQGSVKYLLALMNNSEIRSAGGYPGNMSLLRLKDGKLQLDKFRTCYYYLPFYTDHTNEEIRPTTREEELFYLYMRQPRDAVINPHFPRVADLWCRSTNRHGVIAISPTLVQDFLAVMDTEIELSDGTVLNGENATRLLQHDLFVKYFSDFLENVYVNNSQCDEMFAEAAKTVMEMVMSDLDLENIVDLMDVMDEHIADRRMMFWLADPEGQAIIEEMGASGGLNSDPEKPEVGVYYNGTVSSKLGWYVDLDVEVGEGRKTGDCMTYPVTITIANTLPEEELLGSSMWITGSRQGDMFPFIFVFGPAGGTVGNFSLNNGTIMVKSEYMGLEVGYQTWTSLRPGQTTIINCEVTTAPGVDTPLGVSKTPTLQEYRYAG